MKRSVIPSLIIGVIAAGIILGLQASGLPLRFERATTEYISHYESATKFVGSTWQYVIIVLSALAVSWMTVNSVRRGRIGLLVLILLVELAAVSWICSLYQTYFQPWPAMGAIALAFVVALTWNFLSTRTRSHLATTFFTGHLSNKQMRRMIEGDIPVEIAPGTHDVT